VKSQTSFLNSARFCDISPENCSARLGSSKRDRKYLRRRWWRRWSVCTCFSSFLVLLVVYLVRCDKKENAALSWRSVLNYFIPFARSVRSMPACYSLFLGNECVLNKRKTKRHSTFTACCNFYFPDTRERRI
jgi:hypothetical protein